LDLANVVVICRRPVQRGPAARLHRETMNALESGTFRAGDRSDLEASFERAIEGLWMAYHPIVRCSTQALFGYEALMRTSDTSLPTPGTILNAAESLGRLDDLGRTVRARVAEQLAQAPEEAVLFVNVHARDLEDKTLTWSSTPLAQVANRVVLELAERAALDKIDNLPMRIQELREMGFRIAIDDLGAGYAGLTSFALLEPEFIKLDISLIRDVDRSRTKQKLIQTMTSLARDMGMLVVAEGVETLEERATVIELGCDFVQGFLLARPGGAFPHYSW
jgi:EAL domain-containing protein (putative c-di-GMP-specific phosphodiesterase class I)